MKKNYLIVAVSLGLAQPVLLSTAAHAQDSTRVLNNVVVTATRSPKKLSEIGRVVTVISAEQISHAQGKSLPELLNTVPGITFSGAENAPGISSSLYLRGASTGNTLILIDGFPVNNAGSIENSYDLNAFPLDQIDHIEILKGSGSTLYGSDAAGVINIITKHPTTSGLKSNVQLSGGTYNTFTEAAGLIGKINNTGIVISLSNTDSRGFPAATDTTGKAGFRNDGFHQTAASVNLNQQVSQKFILNGNFQATYNTGNLPYGAFANDNSYTYANKFLFVGVGGKFLLPKGTLVVNLSQNSVQNNYNEIPYAGNYNTLQVVKNIGRITNAEAVFNYGLDKYFDLTSGADFKYSNTSQYDLYNAPFYTPPASIINAGDANNSIASAYTSLFFKSDIFHMEVGGRYNHHNKYGDNFTYTLNPSILLADQFKIFGTIASAFKAPTLYQLFSQYGTPNLHPETTTSYEAGFDWEIIKNALSFNTSFYKYNTTNVIYFASIATPPFGKYKNGAFQNDKGFESELKYSADKLSASAYVTYVTGTLKDANGATTNNLYRRPKNTFGANAYYQFCKDFSAGLNYKYTGDRSDLNFNAPPYPAIVTLKHYNLVDAHLQLEVNKNISLFADLKNLFDAKYTDWLGYNTRGFNFIAGIKYKL
jgi:vitamin B12 transporter